MRRARRADHPVIFWYKFTSNPDEPGANAPVEASAEGDAKPPWTSAMAGCRTGSMGSCKRDLRDTLLKRAPGEDGLDVLKRWKS